MVFSNAIKYRNEILLTDSEEIARRWKEYFCDLLNVPNSQENSEKENCFRSGEEDEDSHITMKEIKRQFQG